AQRHTFGSKHGLRYPQRVAAKALIAADQVADHATLERIAFHFKIGIRSDGIFGRDRVVLYPDMKGPGHRHSLLSDLAYLKPRIRKTELAPKGEFNYRGRLSVFGRPAARADQA